MTNADKAKLINSTPDGHSPFEYSLIKEKIDGEPSSEFAKGFRAYIKQDYARALHLFRFGFSRKEIKDLKFSDPFLVGFYGMLMALVERNFYQAKQYGAIALEIGRDQPEVILVQGKIHELCNETPSALELYREGYRKNPEIKEFLRRLQKLNPRRKKPISFLPRENMLNKTLGLLITRSHRLYARALGR